MTSNAPEKDEFYVGYLPQAPRVLARTIRRTVFVAMLVALSVGLILVFGQHPFARSTFEFQQYREFRGVLEARPYPALLVVRPAASSEQPGYSRYLLVSPGKHGADAALIGLVGKPVRLLGSLIYRDGNTMIELQPGSIKPADAQPLSTAIQTLGPAKLTGEVVDSKCYLGVMNPGRTKVHRDCAARCISGGIPPMLVTADALYLLEGADGRKVNQEVLDIVGETIEVSGTLARSGETMLLLVEPGAFARKN